MDRPALATIPPPRLGLRAQILRRFLSLSLALVRLRGRAPSGRPGDDPHSGLDGDLGYILHRDDAPILFKLLEHLDQKMGGVRRPR